MGEESRGCKSTCQDCSRTYCQQGRRGRSKESPMGASQEASWSCGCGWDESPDCLETSRFHWVHWCGSCAETSIVGKRRCRWQGCCQRRSRQGCWQEWIQRCCQVDQEVNSSSAQAMA